MNEIQTFPIKDHSEWLSLRRHDVTGSEAGALLGVHRYLTPVQLYANKTGVGTDTVEETTVITRGIRLESFVADQVQKQGEFTVRKVDHYYRDPVARLGGTPDYLIINGKKLGVMEIKTIGARDFVEKWRGGDKDGDIIPEPWQLIQAQVYMFLTGTQFAKFAVLPVSEWEPMDVHMVHVDRHDAVILRIISEVARFWKMVEVGQIPPIDFAKDAGVIKAMFPTAKAGKEIDLRHDEEMAKLMMLHEEHNSKKKAADKSLEWITAAIRTKLGDAESALVSGFFSVTMKNTHRDGYTVPPCDFRTLRYKRSKIINE